MPSRSALFECQFFWPEEFLQELERDHAEGAVEGGIVRLTLARRPPENGVHIAKNVFVEATYTTTSRNQLVRLSHYCGFIWVERDEITPSTRPEHAAKNEATMQEANAAGTKVKSALLTMGLDIRAGGLFIEGHAENAIHNERVPFADEVYCDGCDEPIYFANLTWRHRSDRRADRTAKITCDDCDGTGELRLGNVVTRCTCIGGIRQRYHHTAAPKLAAKVAV